MELLRVAIVTPTLSHFEVPLFRVICSLNGIDGHVFHNDLRGDAFYDSDYGTQIDWGEHRRTQYPNTGFGTLCELKAAVLDWSPHVALSYGFAWKGALNILRALQRRGVPVLHRGTLSPLRDPRFPGVLARLRRLLRPLFLRLYDAHHYGGTYSECVLRSAGVPKSKRFFVPYSVDTGFFLQQADDADVIQRAKAIRGELGWRVDDPVILQIGQLNWVKGADMLVTIAHLAQKVHPNLKLLVVGDGQLYERCVNEARRLLLPNSFCFVGFVPSKATTPYYLASSLVIFPSRYETWGRAANEAMLCRRPCLVTKRMAAAGGLIEHSENGYVVDDLALTPIVAHIQRFMSLHPEKLTAMGEAARARACYFSYEAHTEELRRSFVETARRGNRSIGAAACV